jgi:TM2 domain-containing membrane protein YozV
MPGQISCPLCKFEMIDDGSLSGMQVSCPACRGQFKMPGTATATAPPPIYTAQVVHPTKFCFHCGASIESAAAVCVRCGVAQPFTGHFASQFGGYQAPPKNSGIAAVLSFFFPGVGQIYNGEIGKGIAFVLLNFVFWILTFLIIGLPLLLVLWVWAIYDAYSVAERINANGLRLRR